MRKEGREAKPGGIPGGEKEEKRLNQGYPKEEKMGKETKTGVSQEEKRGEKRLKPALKPRGGERLPPVYASPYYHGGYDSLRNRQC